MRLRSKLLVFNLSAIGGLSVVFSALGIDLYGVANLPAQEANIRDKAKANSVELARQGDVALAANDRTVLAGLLSIYAGDPDFAGGIVWNREGAVVTQTGDTSFFNRPPAQAASEESVVQRVGDRVVALAPVGTEGLTMGWVGVSHDLGRVMAARRRVLFFVVVVATALAIGVMASVLFALRITRPILIMADVAQRIAAGDLSQAAVRHRSNDEIGEMATAFDTMLATLRELSEKARAVANGDLAVSVQARGGFADAFREMLASVRRLVTHISETATQINSSAGEIFAGAHQQQQGALHQSSAVEETRRTMQSLLDSAAQVADQSAGVLADAESTQKNNQLVAERISRLASHTQRIAEILEKIKDIANKSDLLALNAALEGTKAGEAGRGFSLVAAQMQRLAESVMEAVQNIKTLTDDIRDSTSSSAMATEQGIKLSQSTTLSARKIGLIVQQQRSGTEQVTKATDDVLQIAKQTEAASKEALDAAQSLTQLSQKLQTLVQAFKLS